MLLANKQNSRQDSCYVGYTSTDASGNYSIGGLYPGQHTVAFSASGYLFQYFSGKPDRDTADRVNVTAGNVTSGIDASMVKGGSISGNITDAAGQPLQGIYAIAYRLDNGSWKEFRHGGSDSAGNYTIGSLTTGEYRVGFRTYDGSYVEEFYDDKPDAGSADPVAVTLGSDTPGVNASLAAAPSGSISGKVTDAANQPLEGIKVDIYKLALWYGGWKLEKSVTTGADGSYSVAGLQTGEYKVGFNVCERLGNGDCDDGYLPRYFSGVPDLDSAELVPVTWGSDTTGIDAALATAGSISGTVTDTFGTPLENADVYIDRFDEFTGELRRANISWVKTAPDGSYRLGGLPTGSYRLYINKSGYEGEYYNDRRDEAAADLVVVSAGSETAGVDAALSPPGTASISGRITSASGAALANIPVYLYRYDNAGGTWKSLGSTVKSNSSGNYTVSGLRAGDYKISFNELRHYQSNKNYAPEVYNGKPDFSSGDSVSVAAGTAVTGIDASLDAGGRISGRVTDEYGQPLSGIYVVATNVGSDVYLWSLGNGAFTGPDGTYTINGLNTGDYQVGFINNCYYECAGGFATEYYDDNSDPGAADPVPVTVGATTGGIDASLAVGGAITGSVRNELGTPVDGIGYEIFGHGASGSWFGGIGQSGSSGWGDYSFGGLAAGDYTVRFHQDVDDFSLDFSARKHWVYRLPQFFDRKTDQGSADLVPVSLATSTDGIDAVLYFYDEAAPVVTYSAPTGELDSDNAVLTASYLDGTGTGIDMSSARVTLDGNDITGDCAVGIRSLQCPVSGLTPGGHAVAVSISDFAGNAGAAQGAFTVNLVAPDITPPTTTDDAPASWQKADFTVTLVCSDNPGGSGCAGTRYILDGGPEQVGTAVAINTEGDHTIAYYSVDNAGNMEAPNTVHAMLDKTAPTTTDDAPAGWQKADFTVNLTCADNPGGSGCAGTRYILDGGPEQVGTTVVINSDGDHAITYYSIDAAGNTEAVSTVHAMLDKTAPTVTNIQPAGTIGIDTATISAGLSETGSGIDTSTVVVSLDGNPLQGCSVTASGVSCPVSGLANGSYDIQIAVDDNAGNSGAGQGGFSVDVVPPDITPPVTTDDAPAGWQNADFTVNLSCADNPGGSGCAETRYSVDGGPEQAGKSVLIDTEGDHTISYYSIDNDENAETPHEVHAKLDKTAPTVQSIQPDGVINSTSTTVSAGFLETGSGIDTGSAAVSLDGAPLGGCDVTIAGVSCPVSGLADGPHSISVSVDDNAGNNGSANGGFSVEPPPPAGQERDYFLPWYDSASMQTWVLMANRADSGGDIGLGLSVASQTQALDDLGSGAGIVPPGEALSFIRRGLAGGPVRVTSGDGKDALVSKRTLLGSSFEEVHAVPDGELSDHYYWPWYDERSPGFENWIVIANPSETETVHAVISFVDRVNNSPVVIENDVAPEGSWTPSFPGVMGGPVEVTSRLAGEDRQWPADARPVVASQRVLTGNGTAFNELLGISAYGLSDRYVWTWYDMRNSTARNWVLIANPNPGPVDYSIRIDGEIVTTGRLEAAGDPQGRDMVTPTFPGVRAGPVEVSASGNVIASQRSVWGPSFGEVPGFPMSALSSEFHMTFYDMTDPGVRNWVLVANPNPYQVDYTIRMGGKVVDTGRLEAAGDPQGRDVATPLFPGFIGGPVQVSSTGGVVMASQRVLWNGYFNELTGVALD